MFSALPCRKLVRTGPVGEVTDVQWCLWTAESVSGVSVRKPVVATDLSHVLYCQLVGNDDVFISICLSTCAYF